MLYIYVTCTVFYPFYKKRVWVGERGASARQLRHRLLDRKEWAGGVTSSLPMSGRLMWNFHDEVEHVTC